MWLIVVVLILNLSRHPGLSARLLCSPLIGASVQSHFHPYGTYSLCKCLVYIPFIYGMLVCVSYSPTERPYLFHNMFSHLISLGSNPGEAGFIGMPPLSLASNSQSPGRCPNRWPASVEFSKSPAFLVYVLFVFNLPSRLSTGSLEADPWGSFTSPTFGHKLSLSVSSSVKQEGY